MSQTTIDAAAPRTTAAVVGSPVDWIQLVAGGVFKVTVEEVNGSGERKGGRSAHTLVLEPAGKYLSFSLDRHWSGMLNPMADGSLEMPLVRKDYGEETLRFTLSRRRDGGVHFDFSTNDMRTTTRFVGDTIQRLTPPALPAERGVMTGPRRSAYFYGGQTKLNVLMVSDSYSASGKASYTVGGNNTSARREYDTFVHPQGVVTLTTYLSAGSRDFRVQMRPGVHTVNGKRVEVGLPSYGLAGDVQAKIGGQMLVFSRHLPEGGSVWAAESGAIRRTIASAVFDGNGDLMTFY